MFNVLSVSVFLLLCPPPEYHNIYQNLNTEIGGQNYSKQCGWVERLVYKERDEFVPPLLLFTSLRSGRGLCGDAQVPADKKRVTRAGRSHQVQHREICLGLRDVWMLLWTGW